MPKYRIYSVAVNENVWELDASDEQDARDQFIESTGRLSLIDSYPVDEDQAERITFVEEVRDD